MAAGKDFVRLEHGSGGALSRELVERVIHPFFRGASYEELADAAPFTLGGPGRITTDSYVVDPPFFPGGNIGRLAVIGTCNDLAVSGASPVCLTLGLVIEEGFALASLEAALAAAASKVAAPTPPSAPPAPPAGEPPPADGSPPSAPPAGEAKGEGGEKHA